MLSDLPGSALNSSMPMALADLAAPGRASVVESVAALDEDADAAG